MELMIVSFFLLGVPMTGWMVWTAIRERGQPNYRVECTELRNSVGGRCAALTNVEKR